MKWTKEKDEVIAYGFLDGKSSGTLAHEVGCPVSTIRRRLRFFEGVEACLVAKGVDTSYGPFGKSKAIDKLLAAIKY